MRAYFLVGCGPPALDEKSDAPANSLTTHHTDSEHPILLRKDTNR